MFVHRVNEANLNRILRCRDILQRDLKADVTGIPTSDDAELCRSEPGRRVEVLRPGTFEELRALLGVPTIVLGISVEIGTPTFASLMSSFKIARKSFS